MEREVFLFFCLYVSLISICIVIQYGLSVCMNVSQMSVYIVLQSALSVFQTIISPFLQSDQFQSVLSLSATQHLHPPCLTTQDCPSIKDGLGTVARFQSISLIIQWSNITIMRGSGPESGHQLFSGIHHFTTLNLSGLKILPSKEM